MTVWQYEEKRKAAWRRGGGKEERLMKRFYCSTKSPTGGGKTQRNYLIDLKKDLARSDPVYHLKQDLRRIVHQMSELKRLCVTRFRCVRVRAYRSPTRRSFTAAANDSGGGDSDTSGSGDSDSSPAQRFYLSVLNPLKDKLNSFTLAVAPPRQMSRGLPEWRHVA